MLWLIAIIEVKVEYLKLWKEKYVRVNCYKFEYMANKCSWKKIMSKKGQLN